MSDMARVGRRARLTVAAVFCLALGGLRGTMSVRLSATVPASQQVPASQKPDFKSGIDLIRVDVVVTDAADRPVSGLERGEFRLFEEGQPQEIVQFSAVELPTRPAVPGSAGALRAIDVVSNDRSETGRILVLVLDDLQTLKGREERVRRAASRILERVGPDDQVAIVYTSGRPDGARDFTADRDALQSSVDLFAAKKSRFERADGISGLPGVTVVPPPRDRSRPGARENEAEPPDFNLAKAFGQQNTLQALTHIATRLAAVADRRKALVYVGEGVDADVAHAAPPNPTFFSFEEASSDEAREFVSAAQRAHVAFYAIDPRGPTRFGEEGLTREANPEELSLFSDRARVGREGLEFLAAETGGFAALNVEDFDGAADRVVTETGAYYLLGYYPTGRKATGGFRRIAVEVTRPGLRVRARKGYTAQRAAAARAGRAPTPSELLNEAVRQPLPSAGLLVRAWSAAFRAEAKGKAAVAVAVSAEYPLESAPDVPPGLDDQLTFDVMIVDLEGRVRARDRRALTGRFTPGGASAPSAGAVARAQFVARLTAPAGRVSVRAAVHSRRLGRVGSVFGELVVPDFGAASIALSGLVIGYRPDGSPPPPRRSAIDSLTPVAPSLARRFGRSGTLRAFVRAYCGARTPCGGIAWSSAVTSAAGTTVLERSGRASQTDGATAAGGVPIDVEVPLGALEPGEYRLVVEARPGPDAPPPSRRAPTAADTLRPVRREATFRVE